MRRLAAIWPALALVALGCSSGSASPGGSSIGPITSASGFCDGTFGALSRYLESHCSAADQQTDAYQFIDVFIQAIALSCPSVLGASIEKGRATINAPAAEACAQGYEQLLSGSAGLSSLAEPDPQLLSACNGAISGNQGSGAPCAQPYECHAGLTCVGFTSQADGTCTSPAVGQTCGAGESSEGELGVSFSFGDHPDCAGDAFCDYVSVGDDFVEQCVPRGASGESCSDEEQCQSGLGCYLGICQTGGPSAIGSQCTQSDDCESTAYCDSSGVGGGVCAPKKATGESCEASILGGEECLGTCNVPDGADAGTCVAFCGSG